VVQESGGPRFGVPRQSACEMLHSKSSFEIAAIASAMFSHVAPSFVAWSRVTARNLPGSHIGWLPKSDSRHPLRGIAPPIFCYDDRMHMRTLIISLAATAFVICSLAGYADGVRNPSYSKLEQVGRTADDDPGLKPAGTSNKPTRSTDEDVPLKPAGASSPGRAADKETSLKAAGASGTTSRTADDEQPLKASGASGKPDRKVEEIAPLRSSGGVNRPAARIEDEGKGM